MKLNDSPVLNLIWLILIVASSSVGLLSGLVYVLAVANVQILSWSIGYVLTSGTNEAILVPSLVTCGVCVAVFILCMLKGVIFRAIERK